MVMSQDYNLAQVIDLVKNGKVVLFLGAGATVAADGPTSAELVTDLKKAFPLCNQEIVDLFELCQDVVDTPTYSRPQLEQLITHRLKKLQPTDEHGIMARQAWRAILTTNYDDLIELSIRLDQGRNRECYPISSEDFRIHPSDPTRLYVFKIMGSTTTLDGESPNMVLTKSDLFAALRRRERYYDQISDILRDGVMLFVGYSFRDHVIYDLLDEMRARVGDERVPWSYALFPEADDLNEKAKYKLTKRKVQPLKADFQSFFRSFDRVLPSIKGVVPGLTVRVRRHSLPVSASDARHYSEYFSLIDIDKLVEPEGDQNEFFRGINRSWGAFGRNWDFRRDMYDYDSYERRVAGSTTKGNLREFVRSELEKLDSEHNKVILIKGMPGCGKSVLARRIAYDIALAELAPVIYMPTPQVNLDYKLLAGCIENLNNEFARTAAPGERVPPVKALILIDDAAAMIRHINRLKDYLASRGRSALIIAVDRSNEWERMWSQFPFTITEENTWELAESMSDHERNQLVSHLRTLGYIAPTADYIGAVIGRDLENSFFATIYSLVHPAKKPLAEIVKDQYQKLPATTQRAFNYICCLHQYNLPVNVELLVRTLGCDYNSFLRDILGHDTEKVIFEETDSFANSLYRTHHRIIAQLTVQYFFGDPERQRELLVHLFSNANLSNVKEREICVRLIVQHIGPNAKPQLFTPDQQRTLFEAICTHNKIRAILHHWGVMECDSSNFDKGEDLLKEALSIPRDDLESYRGESDQNIYTSLGSLYSRLGLSALKHDVSLAEDYFVQAEDYFRMGKHGEFPNSYAYHSHAYMWISRARESSDYVGALDLLGRALQIISTAKDNLNEDDLQQVFELETMIYQQLDDESKISKCVELLRDKYKSPRGYYISALVLHRRSLAKPDVTKARLQELAIEKVTEGLRHFQHEESLHHLYCKLIKDRDQVDPSNYYKALQMWKTVSSVPNSWLLYELGRSAFINEYYDESFSYFRELEMGVGLGSRRRSVPRDPVLAESGLVREFRGTISSLFSAQEGRIRCDSLRNLRHTISFRPIACPFTPTVNDQVTFNISFNYRGPRAESVRRV